jgi:hypothetical protein
LKEGLTVVYQKIGQDPFDGLLKQGDQLQTKVNGAKVGWGGSSEMIGTTLTLCRGPAKSNDHCCSYQSCFPIELLSFRIVHWLRNIVDLLPRDNLFTHLWSGNYTMASLAEYLPSGEGWLPRWLLLVSWSSSTHLSRVPRTRYILRYMH